MSKVTKAEPLKESDLLEVKKRLLDRGYKEPSTIGAIQWTGQNNDEVLKFLKEVQNQWSFVDCLTDECVVITISLKNKLFVYPGSWIVTDLIGRIHVLTDEDFENTIGKGMKNG